MMRRYFLWLLLVVEGLEICLARSISKLNKIEEKKKEISSNRDRRSLIVSRLNTKWPGNIIPYTFDESFGDGDKKTVKAAMNRWSEFTCVKFVPAISTSGNQLIFLNASGCGTYLGQIKQGKQGIFLRKDCRNIPVVLHELGHTIGMVHEQQRPDRDRYVKVVPEHILPTTQIVSQFIKKDRILITTLGVPYDYKSIMHYPRKAFSITGGDTIITRDSEFQNIIGTASDLSFFDVMRVNLYLGCDESCTEVNCPYGSYKDKKCQCMCPDPLDKIPAVPCNEVEKRKARTEKRPNADSQSLNVDLRLNNVPAKSTFENTLQLQRSETTRSSTTGTGNPLSAPSIDENQFSTNKNDLSLLSEVNNGEAIADTVIEAAKFAINQNNYQHGRIFYI